MTTVFMVDLKRFHFDYHRPAVLPRWADRERCLILVVLSLVALCGRSRTHSKFKYGVDANAFPAWSFPPVASRLYQPPLTNSISGETCSSFFLEVSLHPIQYSRSQADP